MKKVLITALVVLMAAAMAGCGGASGSASASASVEPTPTATAQPVDFTFSGPKANVGTAVYALAGTYMEESGLNIEWKRTTVGTALAYTTNDKTDIVVMPRELREEETALYPGIKATKLCTEALAIVAGSDCPLTDISIEQLQAIFNGDVADWADYGGTGEISVYAMSGDASTGDAFQTLVLGRDDTGEVIAIDDSVCVIEDTAAAMGEKIAETPLGIGFMPLSLAKNYDVKVLSVAGVTPSESAAKSGTYTLARNFYIVTVGTPSADIQAFIDYCTDSDEAKTYLTDSGYLVP